MTLERLQKILAERGIASRRHAEELIRAGRVTVNGQLASIGMKADPDRDDIRVDGRPLPPPQPKRYYLLYKPQGVITSLKDPQGRPTVKDLIRGIRERVFPVGRLDWDSEGLLLLTNDGELSLRLSHPRYEVPRQYLVKVKGVPQEGTLRRLRAGGVPLEDGPSPPMDVRLLKRTRRSAWLEVTVREGRNRVVRRTFEVLGHPVRRLRRVAFGPLRLEGLRPGMYRPLTPKELKELKKWLRM
ncbi:MAG TPA: rRNA pseudouridine synthase [Deltaproteobacteria bacterium]|nr:rRNA pseudouridine synthase [Deltaproteobacteria bacterium]